MRRTRAIHPLVALLCCPFLMYKHFRQRISRRAKSPAVNQQAKADGHVPPPLAPPRVRTLTLPLRRLLKSDTNQATNEQSQSPFFAKLPLEIRLEIYGYMFGNGVIHILRKHKRLAYRHCRANGLEPKKTCTEAECWGKWYTTYMTGRMVQNLRIPVWREVGDRADTGLLDPILTCRRLYSESISILYSSNTFDFDQRESLYSLSITTLTERFNMIRSIKLHHLTNPADFDLPDVWALWTQIWHVIAAMEGLRELRIAFASRGFGRLADMTEAGVEEKVIGPLRAVTRPRIFEVEVPWQPGDIQGAPFQINKIERREPWQF